MKIHVNIISNIDLELNNSNLEIEIINNKIEIEVLGRYN